MIVAGIDPSLVCTGIAVLVDGQPELITTTGLRGHDADNYQTRSRRVRAVCRAVVQRLPLQPDLVVIEGPAYDAHHGSAFDRSGLWHGLYGALDAKHIPIAVCAPQTRAKWATGKGNATKTDVLAVARSWWPHHTISNDNEGDAIVLAEIGALKLGEALPFHPKERHYAALEAVAWPESNESKVGP